MSDSLTTQQGVSPPHTLIKDGRSCRFSPNPEPRTRTPNPRTPERGTPEPRNLYYSVSHVSPNYTAKDITVLEGLEPVRRRPGMYIGGVGSTGLHHLVWEILDNAVDEAMNGHASNIHVTLHKDGCSMTIEDDGRGIPVDKHPQ